jgi:predicted transcriptional regulator/DNA-binding XRE family transcriptional regulator
MTLTALGGAIGVAPSALSLIENGRREPRLSLLQQIAGALGVDLAELLGEQPPTPRAALEIALERAQNTDRYRALGLPRIRPRPGLSNDVLKALVGLHQEIDRRERISIATPEEARRANVRLRAEMRERGNYFEHIESAARDLLKAVAHQGGPLSRRDVTGLARHAGFELTYVSGLPESTRSVTDLRHRRIFLPDEHDSAHDPRAVALQTLGHFVLGHRQPSSYGDFLRQRVEVNYFAAALMVPETATVELLLKAKAERDIAIEDLRDRFAVSYQMAAHRFSNLVTHHLGIKVHFLRVHRNGTVYKAYENDGIQFPMDPIGAIEGQPACRHWAARAIFTAGVSAAPFAQYTDTPSGTYWCTAELERSDAGPYSVTVGLRYADVKWFRGRDTTRRARSSCPDLVCCQKPDDDQTRYWSEHVWPSARAHSHLLAALPPGTFPGVDEVDVYRFLNENSTDS